MPDSPPPASWRRFSVVTILKFRQSENGKGNFIMQHLKPVTTVAKDAVESQLEKVLGRSITPEQLSAFLKLDRRTVIKYAYRWGGVEVTPGCWRFFEKRILEVLNAEQNNAEGSFEVQSKRDHSRSDSSTAVPRCVKEVLSGSDNLGKRYAKRTCIRVIEDKYGIFGDR